MALNIKPSTDRQRRKLFIETLINNSSLSKVSPNSINAAIASGVGKVSGKAEKDVLLLLSRLFPDNTFGTELDKVAEIFGIAPRFGQSQSSTYIRIVAGPGTEYLQNTHVFETNDGVQFNLEQDVTVPDFGFTYAKVRSVENGRDKNIDANTISAVTPEPSGHEYVTNEYGARGGRDVEGDSTFRRRIKEGANIMARGTLASLEQAFMLINSNVLRIKYNGINAQNNIILAIVTQNGIDLTQGELQDLLEEGERFFSWTDLRAKRLSGYRVELRNIEYQPIDISFRIDLSNSVTSQDFIREVQRRFSKYIDFRFFESGEEKILWDDLLQIVKSTKGANYVPDTQFYPRVDIATDPDKLPRFRGFLMLDLDGNIITDQQGNLTPVYYPQKADFSFQQTVLKQI